MTVEQICKVSAGLIDAHLILCFDAKWLEILGGIPEFSVVIDTEGRLSLTGPRVIRKKLTKQKETVE